ncbi:hypothetical protein BKA70DRAFT_1197984 [Coprinopsis sp. MPI-PUGE-AT-0042]|nr:hypothetical protein BKA70DRAFT_1197984 [Coprinopsis sp. MPI-PUGE-AT-0042]
MSAQVVYGDFNVASDIKAHFVFFLGLCFAYSTRFNFRRLEAFLHGFWMAVLQELVKDITPNILVIPQLTITSSDETNDLSADVSNATIRPTDKVSTIPDFSGVLIVVGPRFKIFKSSMLFQYKNLHRILRARVNEEKAKTTDFKFDPTLPQDCLRVPDSVADVGVGLFTHVFNWHLLRVVQRFTLFHTELKRMPSRRHQEHPLFVKEFDNRFFEALDSAHVQAQMILDTEEQIRMVLSMVAVGELWAFRVTVREGYEGRVRRDIKELEVYKADYAKNLREEGSQAPTRRGLPDKWATRPRRDFVVALTSAPAEDPTEKGQIGDDDDEPIRAEEDPMMAETLERPIDVESEGPQSGDEAGDVDDESHLFRWPRLPQDKEERFESSMRRVLPLMNRWTRPTLFGTPASNQRMALVRAIIKMEADRLEGMHNTDPKFKCPPEMPDSVAEPSGPGSQFDNAPPSSGSGLSSQAAPHEDAAPVASSSKRVTSSVARFFRASTSQSGKDSRSSSKARESRSSRRPGQKGKEPESLGHGSPEYVRRPATPQCGCSCHLNDWEVVADDL